jgi:hypothetical protein
MTCVTFYHIIRWNVYHFTNSTSINHPVLA